MAKIPEMERRRVATEATVARWKAKEFNWAAGVTCVHLARAHLRNMGHRPPTLPRIRSALAAKRALTERGWASVGEMLDAQLLRIPPAAMLLGDMATLPGAGGLDAIVLCAAPGKLFGFREDAAGLVLLDVEPGEIAGAWRL